MIGKFATELRKAKHLIATLKLKKNALLKNMFAITVSVCLIPSAMLETIAIKKYVLPVI